MAASLNKDTAICAGHIIYIAVYKSVRKHRYILCSLILLVLWDGCELSDTIGDRSGAGPTA